MPQIVRSSSVLSHGVIGDVETIRPYQSWYTLTGAPSRVGFMWVITALRSILLYFWDERFTKPFRDGVLHPNASCASADEQNGKEN